MANTQNTQFIKTSLKNPHMLQAYFPKYNILQAVLIKKKRNHKCFYQVNGAWSFHFLLKGVLGPII